MLENGGQQKDQENINWWCMDHELGVAPLVLQSDVVPFQILILVTFEQKVTDFDTVFVD